MSPGGVRLVTDGDDRVAGPRDHAARVAIRGGEVDVVLADMDHPPPVILVADVLGGALLHVELPALRQVIHGELVHDLPPAVRLLEIATVGALAAIHGGTQPVVPGIVQDGARSVVQVLVLGRYLLHADTLHRGRRQDDPAAHVREALDLQRIEVGLQPDVDLVRLDIRLAGLRVSFHHEPGAERPGGEVL